MNFDPTDTQLFCDIDGVVADTMRSFRWVVWDRYKVALDEKDINTFNAPYAIFKKVKEKGHLPPKNIQELEGFLSKVCFWNPDFFRNLRPRSPFWPTIRNWAGPIVFISTRHPSMQDMTEAWLDRYGLWKRKPGSRLILTSKKQDYLLMESVETKDNILFIEDKLETVINVSKLVMSNVYVRVPLRPWNNPDTSDQNKKEWSEVSGKSGKIEIQSDELILQSMGCL